MKRRANGVGRLDPHEVPGTFAVAVVSALVLDLMVLGTMIARIGGLGFTRTGRRRSASTLSCS